MKETGVSLNVHGCEPGATLLCYGRAQGIQQVAECVEAYRFDQVAIEARVPGTAEVLLLAVASQGHQDQPRRVACLRIWPATS